MPVLFITAAAYAGKFKCVLKQAQISPVGSNTDAQLAGKRADISMDLLRVTEPRVLVIRGKTKTRTPPCITTRSSPEMLTTTIAQNIQKNQPSNTLVAIVMA